MRDVAANANYRFGEIDLVMLDDGRLDEGRLDDGRLDYHRLRSGWIPDKTPAVATLVFVEVRYRRDASFGSGAMSVDRHKRRKLVQAAQAFLGAHREYANAPCRFDVIDADGDPAAPRLQWLRDAFRADD